MTFSELLAACINGLPDVECTSKVHGALNNRGKVVVIKDNGRFRGCGVQFSGLNYDTWFWDSEEGDARSHYMRDLKVVS